LHNEELHDLYSSPSIIGIIKSWRISLAGHVARMEKKEGKPEGKWPLGRRRRRWVDNIRMKLLELGWVMWIGLVWLKIGTGGELF
jgi:hypothetical protein